MHGQHTSDVAICAINTHPCCKLLFPHRSCSFWSCTQFGERMPFVQVGAEKELRTVIEGESLFNDGTAYVLFLLFEVPAAPLLQLFVRLLHMYMSVHACIATLQAVHCNRCSCTAALPICFRSPYSRAGSICLRACDSLVKNHMFSS